MSLTRPGVLYNDVSRTEVKHDREEGAQIYHHSKFLDILVLLSRRRRRRLTAVSMLACASRGSPNGCFPGCTIPC